MTPLTGIPYKIMNPLSNLPIPQGIRMWDTFYWYSDYIQITLITLAVLAYAYSSPRGTLICRCPSTLISKADRLHPRNYPQPPTDYRHTDNDRRLIMVDVTLC